MNATKTTTPSQAHATYEAFYAKQQRNLIGLLISRFGLQQWEAQELSQDAFLIAWRNWGFLAGKSEGERKTWLTTVACRKVIDTLRRKQFRSRIMYSQKEFHAYVAQSIGRNIEVNAGRTDGDTMAIAGEFLLAQPAALGTEAQAIMREELCEALDALAHQYDYDSHQLRTRKTIALYAAGYGHEDIAAIQHRSVSAVKSDIRRARQTIRGQACQEVAAA